MVIFLDAKNKNAILQKQQLEPALIAAKQDADKASKIEKEYQYRMAGSTKDAKSQDIATILKNADNLIKYLRSSQPKIDKLATDDYKIKSAKYVELQSRQEHFDSPAYHFENLPLAVVTSKSDADGKFSLMLPKGKFALAARANRDVMGKTENYFWLVWLDAVTKGGPLMLSNDNVVGTQCKECVRIDGK